MSKLDSPIFMHGPPPAPTIAPIPFIQNSNKKLALHHPPKPNRSLLLLCTEVRMRAGLVQTRESESRENCGSAEQKLIIERSCLLLTLRQTEKMLENRRDDASSVQWRVIFPYMLIYTSLCLSMVLSAISTAILP